MSTRPSPGSPRAVIPKRDVCVPALFVGTRHPDFRASRFPLPGNRVQWRGLRNPGAGTAESAVSIVSLRGQENR